MDDLRPEDIRAAEFPVARRGYDRDAVDRFRHEVAARIEALEVELARVSETLTQLGFDEPSNLAVELETIGVEVASILEAARSAAEGMRSRASADAEARLAETSARIEDLLAEAEAAAFDMRASAWKEGSALVHSAIAEAEAMVVAAEKDALLMRAEAEREALRLVGDARRERDELVGAAREEAEMLLATARQESEAMMAAARQQAEAAQERARALEDRRAELMGELEAARSSIGRLEEEIESKRQALEEPEPDLVDDLIEDAPASHWLEDEGSVRIVPAARFVVPDPVDALELAAEVEALRGGGSQPEREAVFTAEAERAAEPVPEPESQPELESGPEVVLESEVVSVSETRPAPAAEPVPEPEAARRQQPEPEVVLEPEVGVPPASQRRSEPDAVERVEPPAPSVQAVEALVQAAAGLTVESVPAAVTNGEGDELASLFASLRSPETVSSSVEAVEPPVAGAAESVVDEASEVPPSESGPAPEAPTVEVDAFAVRDRRLLPIQNQVLRTVKRDLVELQNRALEELRMDDGWEPTVDDIAAGLSGVVADVPGEAELAGAAGAAELVGAAMTPEIATTAASDPAAAFAAALHEAVAASLRRSRGAGAGTREVAASVSKVFRAWRTDEAERRVRTLAYEAYHRGLLAGLAALGVDHVEVVSAGLSCGRCPAGMGPWSPGGSPPKGTVVPPAEPSCGCTVVPAGAVPAGR